MWLIREGRADDVGQSCLRTVSTWNPNYCGSTPLPDMNGQPFATRKRPSLGITGRNHKPSQCILFGGPPLRQNWQQIAYHFCGAHKFPIKKEDLKNITIVNSANFPGCKKPGDIFSQKRKGLGLDFVWVYPVRNKSRHKIKRLFR